MNNPQQLPSIKSSALEQQVTSRLNLPPYTSPHTKEPGVPKPVNLNAVGPPPLQQQAPNQVEKPPAPMGIGDARQAFQDSLYYPFTPSFPFPNYLPYYYLPFINPYAPPNTLGPFMTYYKQTEPFEYYPPSAEPYAYYRNLHQAPYGAPTRPQEAFNAGKQAPLKPRGFSEKMPMPDIPSVDNVSTSPPSAPLPKVPPSPEEKPMLKTSRHAAKDAWAPMTTPPMAQPPRAEAWHPEENPLMRYYMPPPSFPAPNDQPPTTLPLNQITRPPVVEDERPYYNNDPRLSSYIESNEQYPPYPTYQVNF